MPIYEYECKKCGLQKEAFQRFSDPPLTECESCHGKLRKLISQSTFHLKGSGWYVTDYASKSGGAQGKESKSESTPATSASKETKAASSGSAETKGAAKTKDASSKKPTDG